VTVVALAPPRSALFRAALDLLNEQPDPVARLMLLADTFPRAELAEIQRTLKEAALHLHVYTETTAQAREALRA
jgi:hypothetical protein